jgi:hypothetical protein
MAGERQWRLCSPARHQNKAVDEGRHAAELVNLIGTMIEGSSFSGLFTRVEIGHIRIGSDGNGRIKSLNREPKKRPPECANLARCPDSPHCESLIQSLRLYDRAAAAGQ